MTSLFFSDALLPDGWARNVLIRVDERGRIENVENDRKSDATDGTIAVPGMANLHSHAFQRAMAGLAEWRGSAEEDSFWTWRDVMYRFLDRLDPDHARAIAGQLYVEMLEAGFTAVGEFHYLHHQPDGTPYDDLTEMAGQVINAADQTGIGLTLLPVYYQYGGFGGEPVEGAQRRFANDPERFARLREGCMALPDRNARTIIGTAPHSLRAVTPDSLAEVIALADDGPLHIHVAEQVREVEDCRAALNAPPVEWLLNNAPIDERWCLIHATHMTAAETEGLAGSGAVAGLCPITEANLGDGIFNGVAYDKAGGRYGIGSDSNIRIDVAEELRTLEYGQRLRDRARNRMAADGGSIGRALFDSTTAGGARALGQSMGRIAPGHYCDIVSLRPDHTALAGKTGDDWLNGWLFSGDRSCVADVWVGGRRFVENGVHSLRDPVAAEFSQTMEVLLA